MGINKIELPAIVIEELYNKSLIENNTVLDKKKSIVPSLKSEFNTETTATKVKEWKSLGNNKKNILIVVKSDEAVYLPDYQLSFLTGILSACNLSLEDIAVVNYHQYPSVSYKELTSFFSSKIVLLFDIEPASFGLPMSFPFYQIQAFSGNSFLYSPSLKDLENDKIEKSKLWVCLKRLFNL